MMDLMIKILFAKLLNASERHSGLIKESGRVPLYKYSAPGKHKRFLMLPG